MNINYLQSETPAFSEVTETLSYYVIPTQAGTSYNKVENSVINAYC